MNLQQAQDKLDRYIRARYTIIAIASSEESRVMRSIKQVAAGRDRDVYTWSITKGLTPFSVNTQQQQDIPSGTQEPLAGLAAILEYPDSDHVRPALFVMLDMHPYMNDPMVIRSLRDCSARFEACRHTLIMVSPSVVIPPDIEKTCAILDWPLPEEDELAEILAKSERDLPSRIPNTLNGSRQAVIQALRGLTALEASNCILSAIAAERALSDGAIPHIIAEKKQIVRKSGLLEFFDADVTMASVGGLPHLKKYAAVKRSTFTPKARQFGVEPARGVLLLGLPGTGKSLAAKAIAGGKMPLLRMDVGSLMGSLVGQSEANFRAASRIAEAVAPCVVWLDEIEKALGGLGGEQDGGTSMRVFGAILTWMQETTAPIYFVATANDVRALRPELINRFDDVIFVDLPNAEDRKEILSVHLARRGRKPEDYDLGKVAAACWGFVGREIERVVKSALEAAFFNDEELTETHLIKAAASIVPISVSMDESIQNLRNWSVGRAVRANDMIEVKPVAEKVSNRTSDL